MNIFEDLVEELKEENLLEQTVIEANKEPAEKTSDVEKQEFAVSEAETQNDDLAAVLDEYQDVLNSESEYFEQEIVKPFEETAAELKAVADANETPEPAQTPIPQPPDNGSEFYTKRATEEVSGLQLVEHVFSGVEREQMKAVPNPYDDLECKKALHAFLQVSEDINSPEHAKAEFILMQETESWYSALSRRDINISVTHLRRYCETTRPHLSSTAMISLARFYRNAPFSEPVRSKFDLIVTRLFTREIGNEKRDLPFTREELMTHINTLYSQWASISLYNATDDESEILVIALKFEEFMNEVESATCFDELVKNDFFNRMRQFKESTNENFFAPLVTAAAIECNVRVGNRYVDLIQAEKEKYEKSILEDKYGFLHDQALSETTGKTLQLIQILEERTEKIEIEPEEKELLEIPRKVEPVKNVSKIEVKPSKYKVNKWLLAATILVVVVNVGLYLWMSVREKAEASQKRSEKVNIENTTLKEFVKEGRVANGTFFGVVQPAWNNLDKDKKEDAMKRIYSISGEKGFKKVHLLDKDGKTVGFMDGEKLNVN